MNQTHLLAPNVIPSVAKCKSTCINSNWNHFWKQNGKRL